MSLLDYKINKENFTPHYDKADDVIIDDKVNGEIDGEVDGDVDGDVDGEVDDEVDDEVNGDVNDEVNDGVNDEDNANMKINNENNPDKYIVKYNNACNIKTILRLFPYLNDKDQATKLLIDNESIYYISIREYADKISNIIKCHLKEIKFMVTKFISEPELNLNNIIVTDMTAGVGGNTISFGMHFKYVYAIELDSVRASYLKNNVDIYKLKNINIINNDSLKIIANIPDHNVIFIDPPWGGKNYKDYDNLKLTISNISLEQICREIMDPTIMKKVPEIIILKLPKNYDIVYLYKKLINKKIYYYDLKKMVVIVILTKPYQ